MMRSILLLCVLALLLSCALQFSQAAPASAESSSTGAAVPSPAESLPSYYDLLAVTPTEASDSALLKRAYRKQALLHHPDRGNADAAASHAIFVRLANAYETLDNRRMRVRYDYLLTQGQTDYDNARDWSQFDVAHGFKVKLSKAEQDRQAKSKHAADVFRAAADEAEEFALWTSLIAALCVALLPTGWFAWRKYAAKADAVATRKERSSELKATQAALVELQAEQARQAAIDKQEAIAYQRELRQQREEAAAAAVAAGGAGSSMPEADSWELLDDAAKEAAAAAGAADDASDDESDDASSKSSGVVLKCDLCRKKFKSAAQLQNHENSKQHRAAASKAAGKKSRRDE